jgi:hypothetical protein
MIEEVANKSIVPPVNIWLNSFSYRFKGQINVSAHNKILLKVESEMSSKFK